MYDIGRKRTKTEERSYVRMLDDLEEQARDLEVLKRDRDVVPRGWHRLDRKTPAQPRKARTTIRLDADVLGWFRKLGRGHQNRMNAVLRAYMNGVISKAIEERGQEDAKGRVI